MKLSTYKCGACARPLPYAKRTAVDSKTGQPKEETYGRWVTSTHTRNRYCWPGECKLDRRRKKEAA